MPKIAAEIFLHPGDEAAIQAIRKISGFEKVLEFISKNSLERIYDIQWSSSYFQLTRENSPRVYNMYQRICSAFGVERMPKLFLSRTYDYENTVIGITNPCILISSSALDSMNEKELETYLVADIAGLVAGHGTYNMIDRLLQEFGSLFPIAQEIISFQLNTWAKQRYYTYDRARMLYSDDYNTVMRLIGYGEAPQKIMENTDIEDKIEQARAFSRISGIQASAKTLLAVNKSKPWNSMRVAELYNWVESGMYADAKEDVQ